MSSPPQSFSLSVDDLKGKSLDEVVSRLVPALNAYLRNSAVRGEGLSTENFNEDLRSLDVTIPASFPGGDFPVKVEAKLQKGTRPVAVWPVSVLALDSNGKPVLADASTVGGVWLDWVPVSAEQLKLRSVSGLTAGTRYRITFIVRGG